MCSFFPWHFFAKVFCFCFIRDDLTVTNPKRWAQCFFYAVLINRLYCNPRKNCYCKSFGEISICCNLWFSVLAYWSATSLREAELNIQNGFAVYALWLVHTFIHRTHSTNQIRAWTVELTYHNSEYLHEINCTKPGKTRMLRKTDTILNFLRYLFEHPLQEEKIWSLVLLTHVFFFGLSIKMAVEKKACNCLLLKVNQIGSVTESIQA